MGRVAAPYGVKGWLKVVPLTSELETLLDHPKWWLRKYGSEASWQAYDVEEGKQHGATLVVQLAGLADRDAAARISGSEIGIPRDALPAAREGEIYWSDLVGLAVKNRQGVMLGTVAEVQDFGAHPVLRVSGEDKQHLIPFVAAYVDSVDADAKRIDVDWQPDY